MAYEKTIVLASSPTRGSGITSRTSSSPTCGEAAAGVTSYSLVPSLRQETDREKVMAAIDEQHIDAAIAVRLLTPPKGPTLRS